jgi:hypothetical protein
MFVVIAPQSDEEMTLEDGKVFENALARLWAYPVSRPKGNRDLLVHVSTLLPEGTRAESTIVPPAQPDYSAFADYPGDAFERAVKRLLRPAGSDRFD